MIISRTPFRISFVGGGSDLAAFYREHPGAVLSTSINQYMYLSTHPYFEPEHIRVKYSQTETVQELAELKHPIFKQVLEDFQIRGGIEISSIADIPSGTGMGSSSSFTVGLIHNLSAYLRRDTSPQTLAEEACRVEIEKLKEPIGKQDQYAAAFGGLNIFRFLPDETVITEPILLEKSKLEELESSLILFYTGYQRSASSILSEQQKNTAQRDKKAVLLEMVQLVDELKSVLQQGNLNDFGRLLHENWLMKKSLAGGISIPLVDEAYETALQNGALGGKLLGAGGGGFLLFYCQPQHQPQLIKALTYIRPFPFRFDTLGSQIIFNDHTTTR